MKKLGLIFFPLLIVVIIFFSLRKSQPRVAHIVGDCSGIYLAMDEEIHRVCNLESVSSFPNGTNVMASFRQLESCNGSAAYAFICKKMPLSSTWIEIETISKIDINK